MDDNAVWVKLIDGLPQILTAIGVIIAAYLSFKSNQQSKANSAKIEVTTEKISSEIEVVRSDVNDKMQQFLTVTGEAEHAKGVIAGKASTEAEPLKVEVTKLPD